MELVSIWTTYSLAASGEDVRYDYATTGTSAEITNAGVITGHDHYLCILTNHLLLLKYLSATRC